MAQLKRITKPFVLLCEGQHDSEFFAHLAHLHHLTDFEICSANYVLGISHGGNTMFTEALDELVSVPGFSHVQKVLIVADNDSNAVDAFNYVVDEINATAEIVGPTAHRYVAPAAPQTKAGANPAVVVLMLPWTGVLGSLDTMCLTAASNNNSTISSCVDAFVACTGSDSWPAVKLTKLKLRSLISSSWKDNPMISPAYVWSENTNIVPLTDPIFNNVAAFLRSFPAL